MKCLPLGLYKEVSVDKSYTYVHWYNKETDCLYSLNDQPNEIVLCNGVLIHRSWIAETSVIRRKNRKPYSVHYINGIVVRSMRFNCAKPKTINDVHKDYREDWVRLYGNEAQTL